MERCKSRGVGNYFTWTNRQFERYGRFVARFPILFIAIPLVVCCSLGIGLINLTSESDTETLYVPTNSRTAVDRQKVGSLFPDKSGSNFYEHSSAQMNLYGDVLIKTRDKRDVLSPEVINEIIDIISQINQISIQESGATFSYPDVCAVRNGTCFIEGEFVLDVNFINSYRSRNVTYPLWISQLGLTVDLSLYFKGEAGPDGILGSVSILWLKFYLRQNTNLRSTNWETKFVKAMSSLSTNLTDVAYSTSSSLDDEINQSTGGDEMLYALSLTLLITYACFVASSWNCVANRSYLAQGGVLAVVLGILASFGLLAASGLKFVNIVGVMPFLALGVGVDSMFVIMSEWAEHHDKATTEEQLAATLKGCGGSITIASLTDITAFFIGASSQFISIRIFSVYTGLALAFSYLCYITFFLGCLTIHGRRVRASRHWATCLETKDRATERDQGKSPCTVLMCAGQPPERREDDESWCERIPRTCLTPTVLHIATKMAVFFLYCVYISVSIWGIVNLKQGLVLSQLMDDDSYYRKYDTWIRSNFDTKFSISFIFENIDYMNPTDTGAIVEFMQSVQDESVIENNTMLCWYHQYITSNQFSNSSKSQFIANLKTFLNYRPYIINDVEFTADGSSIKASRCHVVTINIPDSTDQGNMMLRLRELADSSVLDVFAYTPPFIFFEQYVVILPNTLQTVGIAVVCMLVITILFMPHPLMVAMVTVNMISILVGIFGFLYIWDLTLSSITMIHLIMSVGFSVDFSVHVCHGYMTSGKKTRHEKARDALKTSAAPVINGGLSSLIGVCVLIGSRSFIFRSFLKIMVLVIGFGLAHSMLLLPVALSLVGPISKQSRIENISIGERSLRQQAGPEEI